jgi:hypothetical protein
MKMHPTNIATLRMATILVGGATVLAGLAASMSACGTIIGVEEHHAADPDAGGGAASTDPGAVPPSDDDGGSATFDGGEAGAPLKAQSLGQFGDPMLAIGADDLLVTDFSSPRSTILRIPKKDPTNPKKIYDQTSASASTRVSTMAIARGQVWFTTSDGKLRRMTMDGLNPTLVDGSSTAGAMFAFGSDNELIVSSRSPSGQWLIKRWHPLPGQPLTTLATFDAYPSWMAADAQRVLVYAEDEGTIASCATSLHPLALPVTFAFARYLEVDAQYAYFFHAKSNADPMTLVGVPR